MRRSKTLCVQNNFKDLNFVKFVSMSSAKYSACVGETPEVSVALLILQFLPKLFADRVWPHPLHAQCEWG